VVNDDTWLINTIIANNSNGNCYRSSGLIRDGGFNLADDDTCNLTASTSLPGVDAMLGPLADNGGPTQTHALLTGSPAIDLIPEGSSGCGTTIISDQRGIARPHGHGCDSGAYEDNPFSSISVTSPNGGESWPAGSTQTISWTYTGDPGSNVGIELLKGGSVVGTIASSTSVGDDGAGSYPWSIPSNLITGNDYQVRVFSTTNAAVVDTSDSDFTLAGMGIAVVSPDGGEIWPAGVKQTIGWTYTGSPGPYVKIELFKGGVLNKTLATNAPIGSGGSGSYLWTPPATQTPGTDYRIKVTSTTMSACTDTSDGNFSITAPSLTVTAPNGGESWAAGTKQTIRWSYTGSPGSYVKIELYKAGALLSTIRATAAVGSGGSGSYLWTIPATQAAGADYKIKVTSTTMSTCTDMSNGNFSITAPALTVTAPNRG
jgi:hypothetical protein